MEGPTPALARLILIVKFNQTANAADAARDELDLIDTLLRVSPVSPTATDDRGGGAKPLN